MDSGRRKEIVRSDGLRFGKRARSPADQSTRPAESCFAQNARSAASVRNAGIFFFFVLIAFPFPPAHVSRRDDPDEVSPDREDDEEPPPRVGAPESVMAPLRARWRVAERPVTTIRPAVKWHCSWIEWGVS